VHGAALSEGQRLLEFADWVAGVSVGKINRQAQDKHVIPPLIISYCAYSFLLEKPPVDLGSLQMQEIKEKRTAVGMLTFMVLGIIPTKYPVRIPTPADFVKVPFHCKF
jgi:hypothetical protein